MGGPGGRRSSARTDTGQRCKVPEGMVHVPAGEFIMGSDPDVDPMTDALDELPQHKVFLDAYFIDKTRSLQRGLYQIC